MEGECFEHNIRWFGGGVECPLCKLEKLAKDIDNKILYYGFEVAELIKHATQQSVQADVCHLCSTTYALRALYCHHCGTRR